MFTMRKVGGLTFISFGRVRISFCVAKPVDLRPSKARVAFAIARCLWPCDVWRFRPPQFATPLPTLHF